MSERGLQAQGAASPRVDLTRTIRLAGIAIGIVGSVIALAWLIGVIDPSAGDDPTETRLHAALGIALAGFAVALSVGPGDGRCATHARPRGGDARRGLPVPVPGRDRPRHRRAHRLGRLGRSLPGPDGAEHRRVRWCCSESRWRSRSPAAPIAEARSIGRSGRRRRPDRMDRAARLRHRPRRADPGRVEHVDAAGDRALRHRLGGGDHAERGSRLVRLPVRVRGLGRLADQARASGRASRAAGFRAAVSGARGGGTRRETRRSSCASA